MNRNRAAHRGGAAGLVAAVALWLAAIGAGAPAPDPGAGPAAPPNSTPGGPMAAPAGRGAAYVPGRIIVGFRPDAPPGRVQAILRDLGARKGRPFRRVKAERHTIAIPVETAVARYRNDPAVRFIEPDYMVHVEAIPNDPSFPSQWSLRNTGQQGGLPGADIHATAAWDQVTGSAQVIVAMVDTGMDLTHPDLAGNVYTSPAETPDNGIDDDGDGYVDDVHGFDFASFDPDPTDENGHGTHVAGIIGAVGNNGVGVSGVAWRVQLLPLKFMDQNGAGSTSDAIEAIEYAISHGASIINASWGGGAYSEALRLAVAEANENGILLVAAAGNEGVNTDAFPNWPSSLSEPNVISVASTNRVDGRSEFSNYGATSVDLAAPGGQIVSTLKGGGYGVMSGTSMAAPHVSGALALLHARFPAMQAATMKQVVLAATDRIPALEGITVTGGRLDVARMMDGVDSIPPAPIAGLKTVFVSSDRVTVEFIATGDDGGAGTATAYDVRYAATPIDETTFADADRVKGTPAPQPPGTVERIEIRGLGANTTYHVAVVATDEFGNASPLGDVLSFTTTAPPILGVSPADLAATLETGARTTMALTVRNTGQGALDFTAATVGDAGQPAPGWLQVAPRAGSAATGDSVPLAVTVTAAGLAGGDYRGGVRLTSNDPARPFVDVPVVLHAVSAPDIDVFPTLIFFGPVAVGTTETQGIVVQNLGFDDLHVTQVSVDNPQFTVDPTPFTLVPGDLWEIALSVTPAATGPIAGKLTVACDDPDEPILSYAVSATGQVPPIAAIAPAGVADTLRTGGRSDLAFTLRNDGGSSLLWSLRTRAAHVYGADSLGANATADGPDPPDGAPSGPRIESVSEDTSTGSDSDVTPAADISDLRILFDTVHGGQPGPWLATMGALTSRGAIISMNSQPVQESLLSGADVYWVSDATGPWADSGIEALAAWVARGGAVLLDGDAASALPTFNALLAASGMPAHYVAAAGSVGTTSRLRPHEITRGASIANLFGDAARLAIDGPGAYTILEDAAGAPALVAAFIGKGRVLAATGRFLEDKAAIFANNQRIVSQVFDWLGGASWLGAAPPYGSTAASGFSTLKVHLDARRLTAGDYHGLIVLGSNDAVNRQILAPVDLTVIGAPDLALSADSLSLGDAFVGAAAQDSVLVTNAGVEALHVASVSADAPEFHASPSSFTLAPGDSRALIVDFAPGAVAAATGALTLESDDPDRPVRTVRLSGRGLAPPEMMAGPPSFDATIAAGTTGALLLTVGNRAGSDLEYTVRFEEAAPAIPTASGTLAEARGAAPRSDRAWGQYVEGPLFGASRTTWTAPGATSGAGGPAALAASDSLPLVTVDPPDDGSVVDATQLRATARDGVLRVAIRTATEIMPRNFDGFLSFDTDQNPGTGRLPSFGDPLQDVGAEYEIGLFSVGLGYADLYDARTSTYLGSVAVEVEPYEVRFDVPLWVLGGDDGRMNVSGVIGNALAPTDWIPDAGHGTIGGRWLGASPDRGTVAAGGQEAVTLTVDGRGLSAGDYTGTVVVEGNDPKAPVVTMPATLRVLDAPSFAVAAAPAGFGDVFLGGSMSADFLVANPGTLPLHVEAAVDPPGEFTASPASLTVAAGQAGTIRVAFAPSAAGDRIATLALTHDAPQERAAISLTGKGVPPPVLSVTPPSLEFDLPVGGLSSQMLTMRNDGGSPLIFTNSPENGAGSVTVHDAEWVDRDAVDPRSGDPVILGQGGPDLFGTRWLDSDEKGGPVFDWVEIRDRGTPIELSELDETSDPLPIGFDFPFYGATFSTFRACTHGWISFTSTSTAFLNQPLPSRNTPENLVAPFWDDLNFAQARRAYYWNDGTRLIVEYDRVPRRVEGGPYTFEAILYPSGAIVFQYLQMGAPLNGATIGIQNATRSDGLTVAFNTDYLHERMAIRFWPAPHWLTLTPLRGTIQPGGVTPVGVNANAHGLFGGDYQGVIRTVSNDPERPVLNVPVTLHATGIPDVAVAPSRLEFDPTYLGLSATDTLQVTNAGTDRLHARLVAPPGGEIAASPDTLDLAPLQGATVLVRFAPLTPGDRSGTLTLESDDPDGPVAIPVIAFAVAPPRVAVAPASLTAALASGGSAERTLAVSNTGGSDLHWSAVPADTTGWLDVDEASGTLAPGAGASVRVLLDGASLADGAHESAVLVRSDDPFAPLVTVPVRLRVGLVEAVADVTPAALQRGSRGQSVRARIALPEGLDAANVIPSSVVFLEPVAAAGGEPPRTAAATAVIPREGGLDVAFDREAVLALLPVGDRVAVAIEGEIEGAALFAARDTIRVMSRPAAAPGVEFADDAIPAVTALYPNAPNPFRSAATIRFDVAGGGGRAALRVFSASGRLVRTIVAAGLPPGRFVTRWDGRDDAGRDAASGVYFCRLDIAGERAGGALFRASRRMLLLR